jgi:hypothetical protein
MLVADVLRLPPGLFERRKVTAAEPSERKQIELLVDIKRSKRALKFLRSRVVRIALQNVDVAVISRVRPRLGVCGCDLFIELPRLDNDVERLLSRDCKLARGFILFRSNA